MFLRRAIKRETQHGQPRGSMISITSDGDIGHGIADRLPLLSRWSRKCRVSKGDMDDAYSSR